MGKIVLVVYLPFSGKEPVLIFLVWSHLIILWGSISNRSETYEIMKASDGSTIKIIGRKGAQAIEDTLYNKTVAKLWRVFNKVFIYEKPKTLLNFDNHIPPLNPLLINLQPV